MNYLPSKLVKLRKHYNYSQGKLAEILGVETLEYMGYENGRLVINYEQIKKLASFYNISFEEMIRNDDNVTLTETSDNTDELNLEYFIPHQNIFQKLYKLIRRHPIRTMAIVLASIIILLVGLTIYEYNKPIPFVVNKLDRNTLDASDTTVIYVDESGKVMGSGLDNNGQLDELEKEKIIGVKEGATFTVTLNDEGKLSSHGLMKKHADEIASWNNIIDFAVGDGHIIGLDNKGRTHCTGDNTYRQCKLNDFNNIVRVFASPKGSIGINEDGKLVYAGEVFGISMLKNIDNVIGLDFSDDNTVVLKDNNTVTYFSKNKTFIGVETWRNIIEVACGNDFIAGLKDDGTVYISIDNYIIEQEVASWKNIKSIAAGNDYLVAYDGKDIFGIGNNTYNQFKKAESLKTTLAPVSDVRIAFENNSLVVRFKGVNNASGYLISVDAGIGHSQFVEYEQAVVFNEEMFEDQKSYTLSIVSKGDGEYLDSSPVSYNFTYYKENDSQSEPSTFTVDTLLGKTRNNFEAYFRGLDYDVSRLQASPVDELCQGDEEIVQSVSGIFEGEVLTKEELQTRTISYTYCILENNHE